MNTSMSRLVTALSCLLAAAALAQTPSMTSLSSPNGRLVYAISSGGPGELQYSVTFDRKTVIGSSALRLELAGQAPLGKFASVAAGPAAAHDATYRRISGKASTIRDRYRSQTFEFSEPGPTGRKFGIEARAYDDAIAFRYLIPAQPNLKDLRLADERTQFALPRDPNLFALVLPNFTSQYESEFLSITASTLAAQGAGSKPQIAGLPLLMQIPGVA